MSSDLPALEGSVLTPEEAAEDINPLHYAAAMGDKQSLQDILQQATPAQINMLDVYGRTALVYAVVSDKFTCAEILIRRGIDINTPDGEGRTALHWACFHDKPKMVKLLLANNADTFIKDNEGRSCLHLACSAKSSKSFMAVIKARGDNHDIGDRDNWGMACIHWAAYSGSLDVLKHILNKLNGMFLLRDQEGKSPVHWAAGSANLSCLQFLIQFWKSGKKRHPDEAAVDMDVVNMVDLEGRAPLHIAVASGDEKVVAYLANLPNISLLLQDTVGRTPLHWAAHANHAKIAAQLLRKGGPRQFFALDINGASPLHYAVNEGHVEATKALVSANEVVDVADSYGRTALMVAAISGNTQVADALVQSGKVDLLAKDQAGNTALHAAAYYGHADIIALLIRAGSPAHDPDFTDKTALFHATEAGHAAAVQLLMENGADLSFRDEEGRSLLHWAAVSGHHDVVRTLLSSREVDVDAKDTSLRTPLHNATFIGNKAVVEELLDAGANMDAQDSMGIAALHWAASRELLDICQVLLDRGAAVNVTEYHEDRLTPLDYAGMTSNDELVALLRRYGALTIEEIKDQAAVQLQAWWKGHQARITLLSLFKKHLGVVESKAALAPAQELEGQRPIVKSSKTKRAKPLSPSAVVPRHSHLTAPRYSDTPHITNEPVHVKRSGVTLPEIKGAARSPSKVNTSLSSSTLTHSTPTDRRHRSKLQASRSKSSSVVPLPSISKTPGLEAEPLKSAVPRRSSLSHLNKTSRSPPRHGNKRTKQQGRGKGKGAAAIPVLPIRNETQEQVQRERSRVKDIRAKVVAARVIQRAFRRWLFNPNRRIPSSRPMRTSYEGRVGFEVNVSSKQQQIAALTIQLAWRQFIGRKAVQEARQTSLNQSLARQLERKKQQKAVYESNVPVVQWKPSLAPVVRPLEFRSLPSPAVTSFSMALTTYARPFADMQRHRLQRAEEMLRSRHEDAERRLMETEERMRRVLSVTAQRPRSALLEPLQESEFEESAGSLAYGDFERDLHQQQQQQQQQPRARPRIDPHEIVRQYQAKRGIAA